MTTFLKPGDPARLCRGAGGRADGHHGLWLCKPGCGLVQRPIRRVSAGDVGQRHRLRLTQLFNACKALASST
jgi:hypothetical protein